MFHDPFASAALSPKEHANGALGLFGMTSFGTGTSTGAAVGSVVPGVGTAVGGAIGFVTDAVGLITNLYHKTNTDPASQVWKHIASSAQLVLQALNVKVGNDGKWYDASTNALLSQEEADYRAESLMAQLVGSHIGSPTDRYWYDNSDNHRLTSPEAFTRWTTSYGSGATLESVLESGQTYIPGTVPAAHTPEGQYQYGQPYQPTPQPGGVTGIAHAGLLPTLTPTTLMIAAVAVVGIILLTGKKARR